MSKRKEKILNEEEQEVFADLNKILEEKESDRVRVSVKNPIRLKEKGKKKPIKRFEASLYDFTQNPKTQIECREIKSERLLRLVGDNVAVIINKDNPLFSKILSKKFKHLNEMFKITAILNGSSLAKIFDEVIDEIFLQRDIYLLKKVPHYHYYENGILHGLAVLTRTITYAKNTYFGIVDTTSIQDCEGKYEVQNLYLVNTSVVTTGESVLS
jgi:hypothetical protein